MNAASLKNDFPDWLSPMLIKELRQGLRSKIYISAFFLTQVLMILCVVLSLNAAASGGRDVTGFLGGLFWVMIGVPLLLMMPVRAFSALSSEINSRTMELVFLSRLTAWRIMFGKWSSLMVQTLLLVCGILPYVILRYFLGGVDILSDLQTLVLLLICSGLMTATTIAMSPHQSRLLRVLFVLILVLFLPSAPMMIFSMVGGMHLSGNALGDWKFWICLAVFTVGYITLGLEIGASRIAPAAENHAARKRLLAIGAVFLAQTIVLLGIDAKVVYSVAAFFIALSIVDALGEDPRALRSIYQPFLRRGTAGRLAACFLTPGWPSATLFTLLIGGMMACCLFFSHQFSDERMGLLYLSLITALVAPAALIRLIRPSTKHYLPAYVVIQATSTVVTFLVMIMDNISGEKIHSILAPIPTAVFLLSFSNDVQADQRVIFVLVTMGLLIASFLILLLKSVPHLRQIRSMSAS